MMEFSPPIPPSPKNTFGKTTQVWGLGAVCGGGSREGRAQGAATPQLHEVLPWTSEKIPDGSQAEGELTLMLPLSSGMCTDPGAGGLLKVYLPENQGVSGENTLGKVRSYSAFLPTPA